VVADRAADHRDVRRDSEHAVPPPATSIDGRRFQFQASLYELTFRAGGYVLLANNRPGQILTIGLERTEVDAGPTASGGSRSVRAAGGHGIVLSGDFHPFHNAAMRRAQPSEGRQWLDAVRPERAQLEIGELLHAPGVPATLDAGGFNRHTFLCGQSGSGKTYSLGPSS
jgi:hypothetical protein